ncbi:MAG: flagellar basal body rod protein FlgB [Pseudomonadota bacterium]
MPISLDDAFGIHEQAVKFRAQRTELLAANIANADTPGYKARDFDFAQALQQAMQGQRPGELARTDARHIAPAAHYSYEQLYHTPLQPSVDGNTVDIHIEKAKFSENAMQYMTSLQFLNSKISGLRKAIRGE